MILTLALIAAVVLSSAVVAMAGRNLIHSVLLLTAAWAAIATFYLWAGAEFLAFAQLLIYVGAISMVVLFAVVLTRRSPADPAADAETRVRGGRALASGAAVAALLCWAVRRTPLGAIAGAPPEASVRRIGIELMGAHAAALLVVGAILTVALLGGVLIAAPERADKK